MCPHLVLILLKSPPFTQKSSLFPPMKSPQSKIPFMQALNLQALGAIFGSSFLLEKVPISLKDGSPLGPHFEMC